MKRIRLETWSGQLLSSAATRNTYRPCCLRRQPLNLSLRYPTQIRTQSSSTTVSEIETETYEAPSPRRPRGRPPRSSAPTSSAKLAALHARLLLSKSLSISTLESTLNVETATNFRLAQVGEHLLSYHVTEYLICTYPRLPMDVLFASAYAYYGPATLHRIGQEWGVETAHSPTRTADPGLLRYKHKESSPSSSASPIDDIAPKNRPGQGGYRRGISSRVVYDNEFGDVVDPEQKREDPKTMTQAYQKFVQALIGAIFMHSGRQAAKSFIKQHILSRHLDMPKLFVFSNPIRDLNRLCAREDFEIPIARIISETGRVSIAPVFNVGIFCGRDQIGEGSGASLDDAKIRASVNALKAWYLYSPGPGVNLPSDTELAVGKGKETWTPVHIDIGEIVA